MSKIMEAWGKAPFVLETRCPSARKTLPTFWGARRLVSLTTGPGVNAGIVGDTGLAVCKLAESAAGYIQLLKAWEKMPNEFGDPGHQVNLGKPAGACVSRGPRKLMSQKILVAWEMLDVFGELGRKP